MTGAVVVGDPESVALRSLLQPATTKQQRDERRPRPDGSRHRSRLRVALVGVDQEQRKVAIIGRILARPQHAMVS